MQIQLVLVEFQVQLLRNQETAIVIQIAFLRTTHINRRFGVWMMGIMEHFMG
jgi:hypothetical protein